MTSYSERAMRTLSDQHLVSFITVKIQNICNLIGRNNVHVSEIFIATVQISMECETQEI